MDNYPDNIRDFDHDPRSPFYVDNSAEILEAEYSHLDELMGKESDSLTKNEKDDQDTLVCDFLEGLGELDDAAEVISQWMSHLTATKHSNAASLKSILESIAQRNIDEREEGE